MKKTIVIIILLLITDHCYGQNSTNCEKEWLIDFYFETNKTVNEQLSKLFDLTLKGQYKEAKELIYKLKRSNNNSITKAAILSYEANICYNESKYDKSIILCDSATALLALEKDNRYSIKALNMKAKALGALNEYNKAEKILDSTVIIATTSYDHYGLAHSYYLYGSFYSDKGLIKKSIESLHKSIVIRKEINDYSGLAACYSFMGLNEAHLGNYAEGIEYIQKSISIRESIEDKRGLANSYLNLYKIYIEIGEEDKAMASELKSLDICKEINDLQCVSGRLTNLGQIYQNKRDYKKALDYHFLALYISKQLNIKNRIALVHENIAKVYIYTDKYDAAIKHIDSSMILRKLIGDEEGLISAQLVLAKIHFNQHDLASAIDNSTNALTASVKLHLPYLTKEAHQILSDAYSQQNNPTKSLYHYKHFIVLRDSIYNINKTKEILRKELEFNFSKTQEIQKIEQSKKAEQARLESKKQRTIILFVSLASIVLSALLGFAIWQYRLKNRSQKKLESLNIDLNLRNDELHEKSIIIETQHNTIHSKNKEITDSIRYAQKIQTAMMPLKEEFSHYFKDSFVLFEPKDIISGDFFWITKRNDKIIYVTSDCTGHGVPGGFMSMLGVSLLNEIINEHDLTEPALILSRLRKKVITALRQKGLSGEQQDGMDMTICVIDKQTHTMQYAAANHFFYVIRKTNTGYILEEHKGEKQPVGIFGSDLKPFKQYDITLHTDDVIYTFTDGLADQFGGPKGKKFKYNQLKELLLSIQHLSLTEQETQIKQRFNSWRGGLEQVDDVCIIGVKV